MMLRIARQIIDAFVSRAKLQRDQLHHSKIESTISKAGISSPTRPY